MYGLKDFTLPIEGGHRITSGEGTRKSKTTTNGQKMSKFHYGTDWAGKVPGSTPDIRNITSGKVIYAGDAKGYGNVVIVENPEGYKVQYGHLNDIAVKVGDVVPTGGKIGVMGSTGNVTGTHLDLVVTKDGKTLKRDGSVLIENVPSTISKLGNKNVAQGEKPIMRAPNSNSSESLIGTGVEEPTTVLRSGVGLLSSETPTQNKLFSSIADMHLGEELESVYAHAGKAIADAKDSMDSKPLMQAQDPLIAELMTMFDNIDV